ncbi:hypothetical protein [Streptomyces alkaliterrae]|uniref:Tat pathway signal sequence domain protein n=1 Tax=Streptomyces alkaliterrae TaxID=2213162 RepID=A0A5P0YR85_9ACTN|nr:hypothetical protein [Streptomyces alkaliterrae]MBB1259553.1 hypothetical protein [Streptomyces alkaliterrae]MQS02841.1 hypothetical protein [Streptomyces alkaliterrae]
MPFESRTVRRFFVAGAATVASGALLPASSSVAHAGGGSKSAKLPHKAKLTSDLWYSNTLTIKGCGEYQVSAKISKGKKPRSGKDWLKTHVTATGHGIGWDKGPMQTGSLDKSVKNNKGQRTATLKGTKCYGFNTIYVTYTNEASTFYFGSHRNVSAS